MNNIKAYVELLAQSTTEYVGMDSSHYLHIVGSLLAKKPEKVLEIGIGTAMLTVGLVMGLRYNQKGTLTCVDNWFDWHGNEPPGIDSLREAGVTVCAPMEESAFLATCPDNAYDFVVSDGDHTNSGNWVDEYFRITAPDGFIFFHDANNHEMFPALAQIEKRVKALGLPHFHFVQSSRGDERCDRGLLFVINKK